MSNFSISFTPARSAALAVGNTSANIDLGDITGSQQVLIRNTGSTICYYAFGATSATAATVATSSLAADCHPISAGAIEMVTRGPAMRYLAHINGTSGTIQITLGHGA